MTMIKPSDNNCTDFNPFHWACTWGLEVRDGERAAPGTTGKIGFDHPSFTPRALWHYRRGLAGEGAKWADAKPTVAA